MHGVPTIIFFIERDTDHLWCIDSVNLKPCLMECPHFYLTLYLLTIHQLFIISPIIPHNFTGMCSVLFGMEQHNKFMTVDRSYILQWYKMSNLSTKANSKFQFQTITLCLQQLKLFSILNLNIFEF